MKKRFKMNAVLPQAYKPMVELDKFVHDSSIDKLQLELIKIRSSQINGCAYCINSHTQDSIKRGEQPKRIYVLSAWREAGDWFSEGDRAILALTEEVTLIARHGVSDEVYENAVALFGEQKTAEIIMAIITINAWNRIGVSLNMHPQ